MNEDTYAALMRLYEESTYDQGQHDLQMCRICHQEASWHTGIIKHRDGCPVQAVKLSLMASGE